MSKFFYINDSTEEFRIVDKDEFLEKQKEKNENIKDSSLIRNDELEIYNIATVADKEINARLYPYQHVRDSVVEGKWIRPFLKPLLKNHDDYSEPLGRIEDSFFFDHAKDSYESTIENSSIPDLVLKEFKDKNMFYDGTGSVILKISAFGDALEKIKQGLYVTTSQGSITDKRECSICGKDIYDCEHIPRKLYDGKKCLVVTGKLTPIENSIVNVPANDTSTFVLYNKREKKAYTYYTGVLTQDNNENEEKIKDNKSEVKDNMLDEKQLTKLAQSLKDAQVKKLKDFFANEEDISKISDLFDITDLTKFIEVTDTFLKLGETKINDKMTELNEVISNKDSEIKELAQKIEDLEVKLIDLNNLEDNTPETPVEEPEPVEAPIEEPVEEPKPVEVPEPTPTPVEPVKPTEDKSEEEKIKDNFTKNKLKKKEEKQFDYFKNSKEILNSF
ncbi:MAG: coiled-coil domain-containing protein [Cetobacterium sp.]